MINKPGIATAIPKRRYSFGEFTVTVLGDVESRDGVDYRYIAAVIHGQDPEPGIYLTAEQGDGDGLDLRLVMPDGSEVLDTAADWSDIDVFCNKVLSTVASLLQLTDETPYRLL